MVPGDGGEQFLAFAFGECVARLPQLRSLPSAPACLLIGALSVLPCLPISATRAPFTGQRPRQRLIHGTQGLQGAWTGSPPTSRLLARMFPTGPQSTVLGAGAG